MNLIHRITSTILILFVFSTLILAQKNITNNGRVPFSKHRSNFHQVSTPVQSLIPGDMAFGWSCYSLNILSIPLPAGTPATTVNNWAPPFGDFASSAVRGGDGNYYFICMGPPSTLWQMDPATGEMNKIGAITGLGTTTETVNGITYNPLNHNYYLSAGDYMLTNKLYSFDVHTLTASFIASFPTESGIMIDIAINSSGVGYGYDLTNDTAYTFNPVTGATTALGPLGFDCNYGQGMDIDQATGTIYLSAFNNETFTGQLRTMNPTTGATTLLVDWGSEQIAPFAINNEYVVPGPGTASNPNPANRGINIDINAQLSWTNANGATSINVMFGTSPSTMTSIYSGSPVTSVNPGTMSFLTQYYWRVDETNASGTTYGTLWSFKTMSGPNVLLNDSFENLDNWTSVGPLGIDNWYISNSNFAGGIAPELQFNWYPEFNGASYLLSHPIQVTTGHNFQLTFTNSVAELWDVGPVIGVAVTTDGGSTFTSIYENAPNGAYGPEVETINFVGTDGMKLAFYFNGNSYNFSAWAIDDVLLTDLDYTPVELTSFRGNVNNGNVVLDWLTATETNNKGFEIQRLKTRNQKTEAGIWEKIGFVNGFGTTSESKSYLFKDNNLSSGTYNYRLKQIDFDGTFKYSNKIEVNVNMPSEYSLGQNYPNPFNPATKINYDLKADSKVTLKIFNILGQEVSTLLNGIVAAGNHSVMFDASKLNSGVYFYKLEAKGTDGSSFASVKKMILTK